MRMAITLFFASLLSLFAWIAVSIFRGFDKDRAMPMAPFYTIAATAIYVGSFLFSKLFLLIEFALEDEMNRFYQVFSFLISCIYMRWFRKN